LQKESPRKRIPVGFGCQRSRNDWEETGFVDEEEKSIEDGYNIPPGNEKAVKGG